MTGIIYKYSHSGFWHQFDGSWKLLKSSFIITISGIACLLLIVASILSYTKRLLQIKLAWISIALIAIFGIEVILIPKNAASMANLIYSGIPYVYAFPWIAIIMILLSIKGILKDENLVKSVERLR